jgi:3-isopropylmalate/(R)-2-methylmalate dehydratase small subunit
MEAFTKIDSIGAPIDIRNLDTNQLCPTRFNKIPVDDPDYQRILFNNVRYANDGTLLDDFILNQEPFCKAGVLVGDENFGCGSSRESAVYALLAFGIRCVIAPSFGDIFYSNSTKNGLLPVRLDRNTCDALRAALHKAPGTHIRVDLETQTVTDADQQVYEFEIHPSVRERLLEGLDDVGVTRKYADAIAAFENTHKASLPWVFRSS